MRNAQINDQYSHAQLSEPSDFRKPAPPFPFMSDSMLNAQTFSLTKYLTRIYAITKALKGKKADRDPEKYV